MRLLQDQYKIVRIVLAIGTALIMGNRILHAWFINEAAVYSMNALTIEPSRLEEVQTRVLSKFPPKDCSILWLKGRIAHELGWNLVRDEAFQTLFECPMNYVLNIRSLVPDSFVLAETAFENKTNDPDAIFWLAYLNSKENPEIAVQLYQQGLHIAPSDGKRWIELGDLLRDYDPDAAIEAYLKGCFYGDPGSNGCLRAGLVAESQGEIENAIQYYRLSHWSGSIERADMLEDQVANPGGIR